MGMRGKALGLGLAALALLPATAQAQYRGRRFGNNGYSAISPFGPVYNPAMSPEWRQAGGNPLVYEQIMMQKQMQLEQKMLQQQQKEFQKYQQQMAKQQQEMAKQAKANPNSFGGLNAQNGPAPAIPPAPTRRKRRRGVRPQPPAANRPADATKDAAKAKTPKDKGTAKGNAGAEGKDGAAEPDAAATEPKS